MDDRNERLPGPRRKSSTEPVDDDRTSGRGLTWHANRNGARKLLFFPVAPGVLLHRILVVGYITCDFQRKHGISRYERAEYKQ
ncbi:hypothetical protein ANCCAN_26916 [Ancylostoma caninum]|uniref:Uncharacterized protein n=1 Tax=Ancylostoma caninum TaxID=29170 RepID=A0A368F8K2_ANCCA|nr:hypothetical protein ANCCAN_26916 [Ancylostoma caninum]